MMWRGDYGGPGYDGGVWMMNGWWGIGMGLFWLLILAGLVILVIWALRALSASPGPPLPPPPAAAVDEPMMILRRRLANGDITPEEYEARRKALDT